MKLRLIKESEIEQASELIARAFGKRSYKAKARREIGAMFLSEVFKPTYVVAEEGGIILGIAGFAQSWMDYGVYEIFWVAVEPANQKKGVGRALIMESIRRIRKNKEAVLILLTTKSPAFYKKILKFEVESKLPNSGDYLMSLGLNNF